MNTDRSSSTVSSTLSISLSRTNDGNQSTNLLFSPQNKSYKSPINQFYCNICFTPLVNIQNINRASFVTNCGHFYCEQCAQTSRKYIRFDD